jgi:hypothetical protein
MNAEMVNNYIGFVELFIEQEVGWLRRQMVRYGWKIAG